MTASTLRSRGASRAFRSRPVAACIARCGPILLAATLLAIVAIAPAAAQPRVVASIVPVHGLVAAVMQGLGEPDLLVGGAASPHTYVMRPSDARKLDGADLVFWIGPVVEGYLVKPLEAHAANTRAIALATVAGVERLPVRDIALWEAHAHGHGHGGHDHDDHAGHHHGQPGDGEDAYDGHVWLDPRNAAAMVAAIAEALAAADPANAAVYSENARKTRARIAALEDELATMLAPVRERPYIVFHDAYHYFEHRFGLAGVGAIAVGPDRPPGARHIAAIRDRIAEHGVVCVFTEPQFPPRIVATVVEGTGIATGELDPEGAGIAPGPDAWFTLMRRLAQSFVDCLG